jgi:hypothetical protein
LLAGFLFCALSAEGSIMSLSSPVLICGDCVYEVGYPDLDSIEQNELFRVALFDRQWNPPATVEYETANRRQAIHFANQWMKDPRGLFVIIVPPITPPAEAAQEGGDQ